MGFFLRVLQIITVAAARIFTDGTGVVKVMEGQFFGRPKHNPSYGAKESIQEHAHSTLRHGLRHLHGILAGKEPVRGLL
jgi:hypothetical protein